MQSYHHDEVVTAEPRPAGGLLRRDGRGRLQRVGAAALLRARLAVDPVHPAPPSSGCARSRPSPAMATIPVAYLLGAELRGRRAGLLAPALWSRSTRCCSGTRRRRAPTRCWRCSARSRCCSAAGAAQRPPSRLRAVGRRLRLAPRDPLLRRLPAPGRGGAAGRAAAARELRRARDRRWRLRPCLLPLAVQPDVYGHAEWIGSLTPRPPALGSRRRPSSPARPPTSSASPERPELALLPLALCARRLRAARPGAAAATKRRAPRPAAGRRGAIGVPVLLARRFPAGKDFVLARNMMAALVPLLVVVAIGLTPARRGGSATRSPPPCSPTRSASASGPASRLTCSGPNWGAVASRLG